MARKKKKVRWIDRLTDAAKTIADGAAKSGRKKDKGRDKQANCGGCD
jgi:hypothetical protein